MLLTHAGPSDDTCVQHEAVAGGGLATIHATIGPLVGGAVARMERDHHGHLVEVERTRCALPHSSGGTHREHGHSLDAKRRHPPTVGQRAQDPRQTPVRVAHDRTQWKALELEFVRRATCTQRGIPETAVGRAPRASYV